MGANKAALSRRNSVKQVLIDIVKSGVVLRGAGSGTAGTVINLTGSPHKAINVAGSGSWSLGSAVAITNAYVPSGTRTLP